MLRLEPLAFTQGVSLLAQAGTLWVLYEIGRTAGHRSWRSVLAPLFLAGSISFLTYPMTGMETTFFTFLLSNAVASVGPWRVLHPDTQLRLR